MKQTTYDEFVKMTKEEREEFFSDVLFRETYDENGFVDSMLYSCGSGVRIKFVNDKFDNVLLRFESDGNAYEFTRDENGKELASRDARGYFFIDNEEVTEKEYREFRNNLSDEIKEYNKIKIEETHKKKIRFMF